MLIIPEWTKLVWNHAEETCRAQESLAADELCNESKSWMLLSGGGGFGWDVVVGSERCHVFQVKR